MLAFDLPGGWTSPNLLVRFLTLGNNPWQPLRAGFTHRVTGERVKLALGPPSEALAAAFASGVDRFRPTVDAALLDELLTHRSVVTVSDGTLDRTPFERARSLARAADAIVNAGALGARCRTSGLAHGADGFQALVAAADAAADADALAEALFDLYVHVRDGDGPSSTLGMHALGAPDVELVGAGDPDLDLPRLRAAALAVLRGAETRPRPDDRGLPALLSNPHGVTPGSTVKT